MTKKNIYAFKLSKEEAKPLEMYFAKFPEKSRSELLAELVLNALGLKVDSPVPSEESFTPKGSEGKLAIQDTQSVLEQADECPYRAIDSETGKWYCDGTMIPKIVCIRRQQRFLHFERKCYPKGMKFKAKPRKKNQSDRQDPFSKPHDPTKVYRGYAGEDVDLTRRGDW